MKKILIFLALAAFSFAQTPQPVQKGGTAGTNNLTGDFNISTGRTVTVASGGTFTAAPGSSVNFGSGTINWSALTGTPTTLAGYGITDPIVLTSNTYSNPAWITLLGASKISGVLAAGNMPAYTGDVTSSSGGAVNTLATVNGSPGTIGSGSLVPVVTVNAKGLVTGITTSAVTPAWSNITGTPTSAAGYGITNGANIDAWGAKTIPTGAVLGTTDTQTLTNKTINGASNTLTVRLGNDISGFGTGNAAALAINSGAAGAPVLFNGAGGTPSSITLTNAGGTAAGLTAGHVTVVPALTGNVTSNGTTNATTIVTVPGSATITSGVVNTGYEDFTDIADSTAGLPSSGRHRIYYSTDLNNFMAQSSDGVIQRHMIQSGSGGSSPHFFANAIADSGTVTFVQALFSDLSGIATNAQLPAFTGDITKPSGSGATTLATVNSNVGSFGDATHTTTFTVNGKGLITAASQQTVTPAASSLTGVVPSANGGAGSVNGIMKANGSGTTSAATAGTDYTSPTGAETLSNKTHSGTNAVTGTITPTQILVNLDNYNPSGLSTATTLILSSDGGNAYNINGIAGGSDGRMLFLWNANTNTAATYQLLLAPEATSSTAANRFAIAGASTPISQGQGVLIRYDGAASRWRILGSAPSAAAFTGVLAVANGGTAGATQSAARQGLGTSISKFVTKNANFTVGTTESGYVYLVTTGSSTITATLPSASSAGQGFNFGIKKIDTGTGSITDSVFVSATDLAFQGQTMLYYSDGSNWQVDSTGQGFVDVSNQDSGFSFIAVNGNKAAQFSGDGFAYIGTTTNPGVFAIDTEQQLFSDHDGNGSIDIAQRLLMGTGGPNPSIGWGDDGGVGHLHFNTAAMGGTAADLSYNSEDNYFLFDSTPSGTGRLYLDMPSSVKDASFHFGSLTANRDWDWPDIGGTVSIVPAAPTFGRFTAQTAAKATVATYTPSVSGDFYVSATVTVTTSTVYSFTATCTYKDGGGTTRTLTLPFSSLAGTPLTVIANAGGAVDYPGLPVLIHAASGTPITIATTGTFTTVTYNVTGAIEPRN